MKGALVSLVAVLFVQWLPLEDVISGREEVLHMREELRAASYPYGC